MIPVGPVALYSQCGSIYMNFCSREEKEKRANIARDMAQVKNGEENDTHSLYETPEATHLQ